MADLTTGATGDTFRYMVGTNLSLPSAGGGGRPEHVNSVGRRK